ncbi:pyridoxal-dependent decarboxylase [Anaerolineales bacterium HSG25]|nr:pyridoxal-dependent decarboxylase [Anaerolineales bacterium HSG25]
MTIRDAMSAQLTDKAIFEQAKQYAYSYIDQVNDRPVYPDPTAIANLVQFDEPLPEHPQAGSEILKQLDEYGSPACTLAQEAGTWVHIDGAFGLLAAASPAKQHLTRGIEMADSWSVDGHKTLNTPYDCGIILCKNRDALVAAMQASGAYIQYGEQRDNMLYTPDMSRRARAVAMWATLKSLGRHGLTEMIDNLCAGATQFAELLTAQGFQVHNEIVFNQVLVTCDTPAETTATLAGIQASDECWCGSTTWQGQPAIRISVCSWATTPTDVERSVQAFVKAREASTGI